MVDVLTALPFGNVIYAVELTGKIIHEMLEHSVKTLDPAFTSDPEGAFLQMSGLKVSFDLPLLSKKWV